MQGWGGPRWVSSFTASSRQAGCSASETCLSLPPSTGISGLWCCAQLWVLAGAHVCVGSALPAELTLHPWALSFACSASHLMCLLLQFLGPRLQKTKSILAGPCSRQGICQETHWPSFCREGQPSYCYTGHLYIGLKALSDTHAKRFTETGNRMWEELILLGSSCQSRMGRLGL